MGANLCSTLGDDERPARLRARAPKAVLEAGAGAGRLLSQWKSGDITPENFVCQTFHFGGYLCDNWSTEWVYFAVLNLNTDVEVFLNQLSY